MSASKAINAAVSAARGAGDYSAIISGRTSQWDGLLASLQFLSSPRFSKSTISDRADRHAAILAHMGKEALTQTGVRLAGTRLLSVRRRCCSDLAVSQRTHLSNCPSQTVVQAAKDTDSLVRDPYNFETHALLRLANVTKFDGDMLAHMGIDPVKRFFSYECGSSE